MGSYQFSMFNHIPLVHVLHSILSFTLLTYMLIFTILTLFTTFIFISVALFILTPIALLTTVLFLTACVIMSVLFAFFSFNLIIPILILITSLKSAQILYNTLSNTVQGRENSSETPEILDDFVKKVKKQEQKLEQNVNN